MASFRDEILKLANPTPVFKDPEDNSDDETVAKVAEHAESFDIDTDEPSKLRSQVPTILADTDNKYAGKRTSRKNLHDESSSSGASDNEIDDSDEDDDIEEDDVKDENESDGNNSEEGSDSVDETGEQDIASFQSKINNMSNDKKFTFADDGDYSKYGDDDFSEEGDSDDDDDDDDSEEDDDSEDNSEDGDMEEGGEGGEGIQSFSTAGSDDVAKGQAAKQQLMLWDSLLEGRIKLQKAMSLVNQLPRGEAWTQYANDSPKFAEESAKAQHTVKQLLDNLINLQDLLLAQNKETSHRVTGVKSDKEESKPEMTGEEDKDSEDEEILSDSEVEDEAKEKPSSANTTGSLKKRKLHMDQYPGFFKQRHDTFQQYRDSTIQKWYDRTRLAGGNVKRKSFNAFDQSALVQINQILSDKDRLVKRTQLKRSAYRVLGTKPNVEDPEVLPSEEPEEKIAKTEDEKDYDMEIFDDNDFYHQLLRELIEKKASDTTDPVALSRQWLEIQKLRTKSKRKIDTRASKGRKIRYHVHKKLINFMAPVDNCAWTHEARDDLYKSLFGKRFETSNSV